MGNASEHVREVQKDGRTMWEAEGVAGLYISRARAEGAWQVAQRAKTMYSSPVEQAIRKAVNLRW